MIKIKKHIIGYNSQRDNINFKNTFSGWRQCFTTCAWMFMSFYVDTIKADDDKMLSFYFDDVEDSVGKTGIGEKIKKKFNWIRGNTSYWWLVQQAGIEKWMWKNGIKGNAIFKEELPFVIMYKLLEKGPVILQTNKLGGLKGGHIILVVGHDSRNLICHDPYGDATTNYTKIDGAYVVYSEKLLKKHAGRAIRCIYWQEETND